jgi:CO dehydrogenase nickel-insertion accessory protein CooC1
MLIAIWGRDGIGKSTLADALGILFAKKNVTAVIDTDLTQPTLPARINGTSVNAEESLGKAVSGIGTGDATTYLHQHPKHKNLFYAGLMDRDEYMSYEIGLEADVRAQEFTHQCVGLANTVILDISGQRTDPFIPCALINADTVILFVSPDVQGICWFNAVKPLIEGMNVQVRVLPIAAMADRHHDLHAIEKTADMRFTAALPFVKEFQQMRDTGASPLDGTTPAAFRYMRQVKQIFSLLKGEDAV